MVQQTSNEFVTRAFTFAVPGDTLQSVADRVLPDDEDDRATLLAWNPHLALRAPTMDTPGGMLPDRPRLHGAAVVTTTAGPVVESASVGPGHDGRAELVVVAAPPERRPRPRSASTRRRSPSCSGAAPSRRSTT